MSASVGFVLVTYNKCDQTFKLIETLNRLFNHPPIALHHDFSKNKLDIERLTHNVQLVSPHVLTSWGNISVIDATIKALTLLYEDGKGPDWFYLISNACYPIKSSEQILDDLACSKADVHISYEPIVFNNFSRPWQEICYDRYCTLAPNFYTNNRLFSKLRQIFSIKNPLLTQFLTPFNPKFKCYAGQHWFHANRKAALYLLDFHKNRSDLADFYRKNCTLINPNIPEESYYQSVFCNSDLVVSNDDFRFVDWSQGGPHPKTLTTLDLNQLKSSTAHFARKFDYSSDYSVIVALDNIIFTDCEAK